MVRCPSGRTGAIQKRGGDLLRHARLKGETRGYPIRSPEKMKRSSVNDN